MSSLPEPDHDLVVLAGGHGRRLGGVDKAELDLGGGRLLDVVLAAAPRARRRVVVGPQRRTDLPAMWCREEPPGGGPVAALAAAWPLVSAPVAVVLAVDLPFVTPDVVSDLLAALNAHDGAIGCDDDGHGQPLLAAYGRAALDGALRSLDAPGGTSMQKLLADLDLVRVPIGGAAADCDTWPDVQRARRRPPASRAQG